MQLAHERKFSYPGRGSVGKWGVHQVTLSGTPTGGNPFRDVDLRVELRSPSGRTIRIEGFYDGENTWKARNCPDEVGEWSWTAELSGPGLSVAGAGGFDCVPSDNPGPLGPHPDNPRLLADARGRTVYLFGVRNFFPAEAWYIDGLKRERPEDEWSDRDAVEYADTRTSTFTTEDFLQDLVDHGMNYLAMDTAHIGRFATPNNTLWLRSGFDERGNAIYDVRDRYNLTFARRLDEIVRQAGRLGIHLRLIPFCGCVFWEYSPLAACNGGPVDEKQRIFDHPEIHEVLDPYYRYVINRYAAFAHVQWEVANEVWNFKHPNWRDFNARMVGFFREHDPYHRLVTADEQGDVISFHLGHRDRDAEPAMREPPDARGLATSFPRRLAKTGRKWYPAGDEFTVDQVTHEWALRLSREHRKFVQLDELLLRGRAYQRLTCWAVFMAGGSVSSMDHPKYDIHTDGATMDDHMHLARFVAGLDIVKLAPSDQIVTDFDRAKLRVYALAGETEYVLYVHNFADHARGCADETVTVNLPPGRYTVRHYDPKSGRDLDESERIGGGTAALTLPEFLIDHVLHVTREPAG